ncbi:tsl0237 [Thermosynechococcus vestitus BP-1]|uniref:Tsl0237 protein n=1 Tax=Thermosynechococcus vestitus (strain NIES-2133 / IAM M-273 / BP-1) TaxID=197221 RepID=Q8DM84_THEVB|nr:tsl0237 [Thermosynechococcus vestitus BP-1]
MAIGARRGQLVDTPFEPCPWAEKTEASELAALDIGSCFYLTHQGSASNAAIS